MYFQFFSENELKFKEELLSSKKKNIEKRPVNHNFSEKIAIGYFSILSKTKDIVLKTKVFMKQKETKESRNNGMIIFLKK